MGGIDSCVEIANVGGKDEGTFYVLDATKPVDGPVAVISAQDYAKRHDAVVRSIREGRPDPSLMFGDHSEYSAFTAADMQSLAQHIGAGLLAPEVFDIATAVTAYADLRDIPATSDDVAVI